MEVAFEPWSPHTQNHLTWISPRPEEIQDLLYSSIKTDTQNRQIHIDRTWVGGCQGPELGE